MIRKDIISKCIRNVWEGVARQNTIVDQYALSRAITKVIELQGLHYLGINVNVSDDYTVTVTHGDWTGFIVTEKCGN